MQSRRPAHDPTVDGADAARSSDLFRKVTDCFPGMLAIVGADGREVYFNPGLLAYFGMQSESIVGSGWLTYLHRDDRFRFMRRWRCARRRGVSFRAEVRILHPGTNVYRLFLMQGVPLGQIVESPDAWVVTCTDVHDLRQTEAALEDTTAHLRSVFESSRSSLLLCSPDGTVDAVNPVGVRRIRGLYGADIGTGVKLWDVLPDERSTRVRDGFQRALDGRHWDSEEMTQGQDGRARWFHMSYVPVRSAQGITGVLLSAFDITDRKQAEQAKLEHEASMRANRERVEMSLRRMARELEDRVYAKTEELRKEIAERKAMEADLEMLRQKLVEQGERERASLAADLHDDVLQEVLGLHLNVANTLGSGSERVDEAGLRAALADALLGMKRIVGSLRRAIRGLKPIALDELGLRSALESFVDGLDLREGPEIVLDCDACEDFDRGLQLCIYRVGQESIRNAVKHANAERVVVTVRRDAGGVALHVGDDGAGFEIPSRISSLVRDDHFGLAGIAEQVMAWGGELDVRSGSERGTVVEARFPVHLPVERPS